LNLQVLASINEADNLVLAFDGNDLTTVVGKSLTYTINNLSEHGSHVVSVSATSQYFSSVTTTKHFFVDNKTGVLDVDLNQYVTVYPNPMQDELRIESGKLKINKVEIFDISGKLIKNFQPSVFSSQLKFDVSQLTSGQYILQITTEKGVINQKVVK
jgi:pectate lyase